MSNVDDEIDKILKEVAESAWSLGLQTAPKDNLYNDRNNRMTPYKAKQAITTLLEQSERKARIDEIERVCIYLEGYTLGCRWVCKYIDELEKTSEALEKEIVNE